MRDNGVPSAASAAAPAAMTHMDTPEQLERRLIDLEVKASLAEDLLDRLNEIVTSQQARIDLLTRELRRLSTDGAADTGPAFGSLRDELPPHY
jgi:SlyX protein